MWFGFYSRATGILRKSIAAKNFYQFETFTLAAIGWCLVKFSLFRYRSNGSVHFNRFYCATDGQQTFPPKLRNSVNWFKSANFFFDSFVFQHSSTRVDERPRKKNHRTLGKVSLHSSQRQRRMETKYSFCSSWWLRGRVLAFFSLLLLGAFDWNSVYWLSS